LWDSPLKSGGRRKQEMNGWAIAYLLLIAVSLGQSLAEHGKNRKVNFWASSINALIAVIFIYKMGGFHP